MSKKSPGKTHSESASTAAALHTLASTVLALLEEGGLDAQFAAKLSRRIAREADETGLSETQLPEDLGVLLKLQELDVAVTRTRANGLIAALENLRHSDASETL